MNTSSAPIAVSARMLSKRYWKGGKVRSDTLRDAVTAALRTSPKGEANGEAKEFWALRDVSFDVHRGETLGIIGANGSGKSTLLKLLSRVITPTSGEFDIVGRVASLLEVGTGFHPELTGRENMFFNGSLLGLTRKEIAFRSDEIFEFAGVEEFADTPVKHYSSGMYVRLAFSVAAQLDPEILIIDEALAVGDYQFQQRCINHMRAVAQAGKTVLFVTHSLGFIELLCNRVLFLEGGRPKMLGESADVVAQYLDNITIDKPISEWTPTSGAEQPAWNPVKPHAIRLVDEGGYVYTRPVQRGTKLFAEIDFEMFEDTVDVSIGVTILSEHNVRLLRSTPFDTGRPFDGIRAGRHRWKVELPIAQLSDGTFTVSFDADRYESAWYHNPYNSDAKVAFVVEGSAPDAALVFWHRDREGSMKLPMSWSKVSDGSMLNASGGSGGSVSNASKGSVSNASEGSVSNASEGSQLSEASLWAAER